MKRFFASLAVVLGLVSCQTEPEGLGVNVGGEQDVNITVSLPEGTRANSALGAFDNIDMTQYDIRYIFQVFNAEGTQYKTKQVVYSDEKTVSFPVRLIPNRNYNFVVWADLVKNGETENAHYIIGASLEDITLNAWAPMDETRDAYTGRVNTKFDGATPITVELTRPFAKMRVITTDMAELLGVEPSKAKVEYTTKHYSSFNALAQQPENKDLDKTHDTFKIVSYDGEVGTLFTDYFFATASQEVVKFDMEVIDSNDQPIIKRNFTTDIPVKRNFVTTIMGDILTYGDNITVEVKPDFANNGNLEEVPFHYVAVSNAFELVKALYEGREIIVLNDITVTAADVEAYLATRAATAINPVINLNGFTITFVNDTNEPLITIAEGSELTITDDSEDGTGAIVVEGTGVAIENNGTINIEGGELNDGAIENNGTTNVTDGTINEGAITDTANGTTSITGGEFTYEPDADDLDDDYEAKKDENGDWKVELKPIIAKVGEVEYRTLQKAFDAVEEGANTIVLVGDVNVNAAVVLAEGKTATLDLNGKTLTATGYAIENNGTLTITGDGTINGIVYGENGTTTVENGTFNPADGGAYVFLNSTAGTLIINGGTINTGSSYPVYSYNENNKLIINNVTINGKFGCVNAYGTNGSVEINGGTFQMTGVQGMTSHITYFSSNIVATINGGTFEKIGDISMSATGGGGICANGGANLTINGGTFAGDHDDVYNYGGTISVKGGEYKFKPDFVADGYVVDEIDGKYQVVKDVKIAKVGTTEYRKIDDAIAAWTHNATLTLLSDVTLNDVITIKSTEYRVLDLGTFTMTAAKGKDAISITAEGRSSASYALDIKADATNPGGITATSKAVVKTTGKSGVKDRPIIRFYNGVYNASNVISHSGSNGTNCPQFQFHNGVYNANISANRALIQIYGGTFNGRFFASVDSSAYMLISGGKFKYLDNLYGSALNADKFTIGSTKGAFDRGVYVDDEGYIVVGGSVITEFGDKFAAKATNASKAGSYLPYSSAAANGLYYTNAEMAIAKHGEANVVLK